MVLNWDDFTSRAHLAVSGDFLYHWHLEKSLRVLLNVMQCTGLPHNKELSSQNVSRTDIEKPCCRDTISLNILSNFMRSIGTIIIRIL